MNERCSLCNKKGAEITVPVLPEHPEAYAAPVHTTCDQKRAAGAMTWRHETLVLAICNHNMKHRDDQLPYPPRPDTVTRA